MSDGTDHTDWRRMKPADFGTRTKARQDALFLVDEPDACGTEAMDGLGFGVALWADQPGMPPTSSHRCATTLDPGTFCSLIGNGCSRGTGPSATPWHAASPLGVWRVATPPAPYPPDAGAAHAEPHGDAAPRTRDWTRPALQAGRVAAYSGETT